MADITYTPRAPGCEVRLTTSDGHELVVSLSGVKAAKGRAEGDTSLTENLALVTLGSEYAANARAYRRLRSVLRDLIGALAATGNRFVLTTRYVSRALRLLRAR
jgi:hypothetical protein